MLQCFSVEILYSSLAYTHRKSCIVLNLQNLMCGEAWFSQIWSHISLCNVAQQDQDLKTTYKLKEEKQNQSHLSQLGNNGTHVHNYVRTVYIHTYIM